MSDTAATIPVKVEVSDNDKTAIILIPWSRLSKVGLTQFQIWFDQAATMRREWEAKGYRCNGVIATAPPESQRER